MNRTDRLVAGLRCSEVLARLGDYVGGELTAAEVAHVQAHLRGCELCERFGGEFATVVATIRRTLAEAPAGEAKDDPKLLARVRAKLLGGEGG